MSTGVVVHVKNNSGSLYASIIVTNAVLTGSQIELEGGPSNTMSVLSQERLFLAIICRVRHANKCPDGRKLFRWFRQCCHSQRGHHQRYQR